MGDPRSLTLVFGSQDLDVNPASLEDLRQMILESSSLQWINEVILDLPKQWQAVKGASSALQHFSGEEQLAHLLAWLRRGDYTGTFPPPNITVTPLVVVTQLAQFTAFVERNQPGIGKSESFNVALKSSIETCGLCTGLLTAAAVASSKTLAQLEKNGAAAIRLAMAIGALVDATDDGHDWLSVVAGWTMIDGGEKLHSSLREFPQAYVAVKAEPRQVTLTAPKGDFASLTAQLRAGGFVTTQTALRGAFHLSNRTEDVERLLAFFDSNDEYQFSKQVHPMLPASPKEAKLEACQEPFHQIATRAMLCETGDWHALFAEIENCMSQATSSVLISFGRKRCVPQSLSRRFDSRFVHAGDSVSPCLLPIGSHHDVAIIGMACHFPGGRDLQEFWDTLCTGLSQHIEVPQDRIDFSSPWRKDIKDRKWFGNFIQDHAAFDHKFFRKTPVEVISTDPQQRLIMQVAYQALQQSGYFSSPEPNTNVACFIGIGPNDYEGRVANHEPTAYTATGNLRSFAAGKISHFFGWSAPGITIDTACSSSAVAIHEACKAIITGECEAALAGGTNHLSGAEWFQNLAGASFLSQTGQCKPFDAAGDGYCRSEGAGAVFLKKYSNALRDGDQVLGIIKATFVAQNENCSAITAPTARSLSDGFRTVVARSGLDSKQISAVEAHGTGTQVGDKAEYTAIRDVFGNDGRSSPLTLGSAKGHIGHLESASGIASVIKTLLMMHNETFPPQASHSQFNPNLPGPNPKEIQIAAGKIPWSTEYKAALINNYGASGSNASIVLSQAPLGAGEIKLRDDTFKQPFWLAAHHEEALKRYAAKLAQFLRSTNTEPSIADLAFQISLQTNRSLEKGLMFSSGALKDLLNNLDSYASGQPDKSIALVSRTQPRPVILVFGGQVSTSLTVSRDLYSNAKLFRDHLDCCNETGLSLGFPSILPRVFDPSPVEDIVHLQLMLFSVQYSSAQSWIDSGVRVSAVAGHSFGELVALCVSGVLSLRDALWMVASRARIIQEKWGADSGGMMFVEGDIQEVNSLLKDSQTGASIACFNGPRSFTVAGTTPEIDQLQSILSLPKFSSLRTKRLPVTNAFHSKLVEPLITDLQSIGENLIWRDPKIHQERATQDPASHTVPRSDFVATHMRDPVYFGAAIERLANRFPTAIWLEAGTGSGITSMASKALGAPAGAFFQPSNLSNIDNLAETTVNLWKQGLNVSFWPHHKTQTREYMPILLPPYQFDKHVHWLERKEIPKLKEVVAEAIPDVVPALWTFMGYQTSSKSQKVQEALFRINTASTEFRTHVSAHVIAQAAPICPTGFQYRIATDAIDSLVKKQADESMLRSELQGMVNLAPIVDDNSKQIHLVAQKGSGDSPLWTWRIESSPLEGGKTTLHVTGQILYVHINSPNQDHMLARYERLVDHQQCKTLLDGDDVNNVLQGQRNIYKLFSPVVHYNEEEYKGLQKLVSRGNESAGRIVRPEGGLGTLNVGLADSFCQVAGIFVNCMADCEDGEMYLSNKLEHWISPSDFPGDAGIVYEVYARHSKSSDREWMSDIFVFDPASGRLLAAIFGMGFIKMKISAMARMLESLTGSANTSPVVAPQPAAEPQTFEKSSFSQAENKVTRSKTKPKTAPAPEKKAVNSVEGPLRDVLCNMLGLEEDDIRPGADLMDLGIDSLLAMELARDVQRVCNVELDAGALLALTDFQSLIDSVRSRLGEEVSDDSSDEGTSTDVDQEMFDSGYGTPDKAKTESVSLKSDLVEPDPDRDSLPSCAIIAAFEETKALTDEFIQNHKLAGFSNGVLPTQNELVLVHIMDAFEQLGCDLRSALAGKKFARIPHLPRHQQIVDIFYGLLEKARVVDLTGGEITRTAVPTSTKSAATLLSELLKTSPEHGHDHRLTSLSGSKLAECMKGEAEGVQLLFGSAENRALVSASYADSPIHSTMVNQLAHFFKVLLEKADRNSDEPIRIMELGAGTGGTTSTLLPILAASGRPIIYTVTDLSSGLVAGLRKRFNKQFPFTHFEVVNMEVTPPSHLLHQQHAILATNCVHATKDLSVTTANIRKMLRPGGFLVMIEMTSVLPWVDLVFGLTEGWWLFNDGRTHACIKPAEWEKTFRANGYGYADWTEGNLPESEIQQIIIAAASEEEHHRVAMVRPPKLSKVAQADSFAREASVSALVSQFVQGFTAPKVPDGAFERSTGRTVLVTGATGSLGAHLVAHFATQSHIGTVVCLNRESNSDPTVRQLSALESRGLALNHAELAKLHVLESDTAKPQMGLSTTEYIRLAMCVTEIVHNAWPMSLTRSLKGFTNQFKTMRNLINLARICRQSGGPKIGFQLIGSVATVGYHIFATGEGVVPEKEMHVASAMPIGYAEAKLVCEKMLQQTLRSYPNDFRAMTVRLGQIAGSRITGGWNETEHIGQLIKSSQTLNMLPDLRGDLSWCPVNDIATSLGEVLMCDISAHAVYHIENPVRQPWPEMMKTFAKALNIPPANIIPFGQWLQRVRNFPPSLAQSANPAVQLMAFWSEDFIRMSCGTSEGGLALDTKNTKEQSSTFRALCAMPEDVVIKYLDAWKRSGFLQ